MTRKVPRCASEPPPRGPTDIAAAAPTVPDTAAPWHQPSYAEQLRQQINERDRLRLEERRRHSANDRQDYEDIRSGHGSSPASASAPRRGVSAEVHAQRARERGVLEREEAYTKWMHENQGGRRQTLASKPRQLQAQHGIDLSMSMQVEASSSPPTTPAAERYGAHPPQAAHPSRGPLPPAMPVASSGQGSRHGSAPSTRPSSYVREMSPQLAAAHAMLGGAPQCGTRNNGGCLPPPVSAVSTLEGKHGGYGGHAGGNNDHHGDALSSLLAEQGIAGPGLAQPRSVVVSQPPGGRSSFSFR